MRYEFSLNFLNLGGLVKWVSTGMVKLSPASAHSKVPNQEQIGAVLAATRSKHERAMVELLYGTGAGQANFVPLQSRKLTSWKRRIRVTEKLAREWFMFTGTGERPYAVI